MAAALFLWMGLLWGGLYSHSHAWSARGHAEIADAAYARLDQNQQQAFMPIFAAGPWADASRWDTPVAGAAVWPDRIRDLPVKQLFKRYGSGKVPAPLRRYRHRDTGQWHYVNAHYLTEQGKVVPAGKNAQACPPPPNGQLHDVWPLLLDAYSVATDVRDQAIVLAFIVHMVGDAYQPLHTLAALDEHCEHDRGGNGYCVEKSKGRGRQCKTNLHQLWDRGFGVFESDWYAPVKFHGDPRSLKVGERRLGLAADVYPSTAEAAFSPQYQRQAAVHVRRQARMATAHLHRVLSELNANGKKKAKQ